MSVESAVDSSKKGRRRGAVVALHPRGAGGDTYIYIYIYIFIYMYIYIYISLSLYIYIYIYISSLSASLSLSLYIYIYIYIYILYMLHPVSIARFPLARFSPGAGLLRYVFFVYTISAKTFQGLGPKRRESSKGDRV